MKLAAVTMAYNEPIYAPIWLRHYARQVGAAHCYVIDHGSDDGSLDTLGVTSVLRLPRSPQDDPRRARFLSGFCAALLQWYDAVLYADIDELLVADPAQHRDLAAYAASMPAEVITAIGLDVQHLPGEEAGFDPVRSVGEQRRWARFNSAMCKPALIRRPVAWAPGFHCADVPPVFDRLYLFHLRYFDLGLGLARLAKTRTMPWAVPGAGSHQRMDDAAWSAMVRAIAGLPRLAGVPFDPALPPIAVCLDALRASMAGREGQTYRYDLNISPDALWEIPARFRTAV